MSYARLVLAQEEDKPDNDRYLTPPWAVAWFLRTSGWIPVGDLIWDPAAAGVRGWTIGGEVAKVHNRRVWLSDIAPASSVVDSGDYFKAKVPEDVGVTHITNPPFNVLPGWLDKARSESAEVVLLVPINWLFNGKNRMQGLSDLWAPSRRMAFGLDDDTVARMQSKEAAQLRPNPTSITGWGLSSTGEAHGWARWLPGYAGPCRLHPPTKPTAADLGLVDVNQLTLFGG